MDNSSTQSDQGKSSSTASVLDNKKLKVDPQNKPEEKNGTLAGCRLTQEMLDFYHQKSKEEKRYRREYEEAAYRVYGTIPYGVDPRSLGKEWPRYQKNGALRHEGEQVIGAVQSETIEN